MKNDDNTNYDDADAKADADANADANANADDNANSYADADPNRRQWTAVRGPPWTALPPDRLGLHAKCAAEELATTKLGLQTSQLSPITSSNCPSPL